MKHVLCLLGLHDTEVKNKRVETAGGCPVWIQTLEQCRRCSKTFWLHQRETGEITPFESQELNDFFGIRNE